MTPSKILFYFCISFIAGIIFESVFKTPQFVIWGVLITAVLLILIFSFLKNRNYLIAGFCVLLALLGLLRVQASDFHISADKLKALNDSGQEISLEGTIISEPDKRSTWQKFKIKTDVYGSTVLVNARRYPDFNYLDKIKITGNLESPFETDEFSYKDYLMKDGIYSVMAFPEIELISKEHQHGAFSFLCEKLFLIKQRFRENIKRNFSPPYSSVLEGMILGDSGAMDEDLKNKLNITGLRHIIAVSGTHIIILASILMSLFVAMGFWRHQAFYFSLILIWAYIILTGLSASGIRAGIMGSMFLFAQVLGRQGSGMRLIVFACALMLLQNPLLLFYDVGFQLSFLACLGLILLNPLISGLIKKFTKDNAKNAVDIVSATFSAQIFTIPVLLYNFGNISLISPVTNILIVPIVYWIMVFGFIFSIAGSFFQPLAALLAVPCWLFLSYFIFILNSFSKPWAVKVFQNVSWIWLASAYFALAVIMQRIKKLQRERLV